MLTRTLARTLTFTLFALTFAGAAHAQDTSRTASADRDVPADNGRSNKQVATIGRSKPFGLGVVLGEPTALSGKLYLQRAHALDMAFAVGPGPGTDVDVYGHLVYLIHPSVIAREPGFNLGWHVGAGGVAHDGPYWAYDRFGPDDDLALGVRTPIGLDFDLKDVPLQIFGDVALDTYIVPATTVDLGASVGVRYYF